MGVTIVNRYERVIVLRWGKHRGTLSQGFHWLWPIMERGLRVDLRERVERVPTQKYITQDNVVVDMDFVVYYRALADQAEKAVLDVVDFRAAVVSLAFATLRSVIGATTLASALAEREKIRDLLQIRLDEVTGRWGIKVSQVEINEIDPPSGVKAAMERQKSADAIKTAEITESEGGRQAAINLAEGEKQAAILKAEGVRQATILHAEGERQAAILNAEGYSTALERIFGVARNIDAKTMSLQYFETLKAVGASPSTKFIFPMEFTGLLRPFMNLASGGDASGTGGSDR
ncbi:MAG: SPFH/Band 7/PHB domain protein [Chloroflexi bacterium]|nr:SPFH/Band 7/PHB domain protein [Chloroflexota bacterium]